MLSDLWHFASAKNKYVPVKASLGLYFGKKCQDLYLWLQLPFIYEQNVRLIYITLKQLTQQEENASFRYWVRVFSRLSKMSGHL